MMDKLVAMYENGAITAEHMVLESLHMVDPQNPTLVLGALPPEILERMLRYAREFQPGAMLTNYGLSPALDQVQAAKNWIETRSLQHGMTQS
jgi:hypothetical protein